MKILFTALFLCILSVCYGHLWLRVPVSRHGENHSGSKRGPCGTKTLTQGSLTTTYEVGEKVSFSFRVNQHGPDPFSFKIALGDTYVFNTTVASGIPNNVSIAEGDFRGVFVPVTIPNVLCEWCVIQIAGMGNQGVDTWYNCGDIKIVAKGSKNSPIVGKISPNSGPTLGGTPITVTGSKFGDNSAKVACVFESVEVTAKRVSNTTITCTSPPYNNNREGLFRIKVNGLTSSNYIGFSYTGNPIFPTITSITPEVGKPGDVITISGSHFYSANMECIFGSVIVEAVGTSSTEATCQVPEDLVEGNYTFEVTVDNSPMSQSGKMFQLKTTEDSKANLLQVSLSLLLICLFALFF